MKGRILFQLYFQLKINSQVFANFYIPSPCLNLQTKKEKKKKGNKKSKKKEEEVKPVKQVGIDCSPPLQSNQKARNKVSMLVLILPSEMKMQSN